VQASAEELRRRGRERARRTCEAQVAVHPGRPQAAAVRLDADLGEADLLALADGLEDEARAVGVAACDREAERLGAGVGGDGEGDDGRLVARDEELGARLDLVGPRVALVQPAGERGPGSVGSGGAGEEGASARGSSSSSAGLGGSRRRGRACAPGKAGLLEARDAVGDRMERSRTRVDEVQETVRWREGGAVERGCHGL